MPEPEQLLTVRRAAEFLGVHEKTLYLWTQSHRVPHIRLGSRAIRFRKSDLLTFLEELAVPVAR